LGITIPLSLVIRDKPEKYGWLPDGETVKTDVTTGNKVAVEDSGREFTVKEALKTRAFWQLALAMVFQILMVNAVTTHMLPYLSSIGISRTTASLVASAVPLTSVLGRFGFGWSSDRIQQRWIMAFGYALMGIGMLFFTLSAKAGIFFLIPSILFFSVGFGGNATVRASVIRDYYGRKHFGAIHGLTMGPAVIGNLVGPPLAGWFYDTQGSYQNIWLILTVLAVIPLVLMLTMSKPKQAQ
jgi:sugar phosphate permease